MRFLISSHFIRIFKGTAVAFIFNLLMLFLLSLVLSNADYPEKYFSSVVIILIMLSIILSGIISSRGMKSGGWYKGAIAGIVYSIALYILSVIVFRDLMISNNLIIITAASIVCGAVGGIIGINIKQK